MCVSFSEVFSSGNGVPTSPITDRDIETRQRASRAIFLFFHRKKNNRFVIIDSFFSLESIDRLHRSQNTILGLDRSLPRKIRRIEYKNIFLP